MAVEVVEQHQENNKLVTDACLPSCALYPAAAFSSRLPSRQSVVSVSWCPSGAPKEASHSVEC
jgi:hypothetical protein